MPNLVGMPFSNGQELLDQRMCQVGNSTAVQARTRLTRAAPPGTFIGQSPPPGTVLTKLTVIYIYVEQQH